MYILNEVGEIFPVLIFQLSYLAVVLIRRSCAHQAKAGLLARMHDTLLAKISQENSRAIQFHNNPDTAAMICVRAFLDSDILILKVLRRVIKVQLFTIRICCHQCFPDSKMSLKKIFSEK